MFYLATAAFTHGSSTISPTQEAGAESMHYAEFIDLELELGLNLLSAPKLSLDGVNERERVSYLVRIIHSTLNLYLQCGW